VLVFRTGEALAAQDQQYFRFSLHLWSIHIYNNVIYRDQLVLPVFNAISESMSYQPHDQSRAYPMLSLFEYA